jgi:hypothetical protein
VTDGNKAPGSTITKGNGPQELLDDLKARGYELSVTEAGKLSTAPGNPPITPVIWHALQANYRKLVNLLRPPVTDTNSLAGANVRKDNTDWSRVADLAPARGEELERVIAEYAEAYKAASAVVNAAGPKDFIDGMRMHWTEMDKRRSGRDREAKRRIDAAKKGGACGKCGGAFKDREAVYAKCRGYAGMAGGLGCQPYPRFEAVSVCEACAPEYMTKAPDAFFDTEVNGEAARVWYGKGFAQMQCATCERPVVHERTARWQPRVFCCYRCQYTFHNRRRSERDQGLREKVCEVCSKEFTAKRAHAKTCSPACKQRAYREREKADGVPLAKPR